MLSTIPKRTAMRNIFLFSIILLHTSVITAMDNFLHTLHTDLIVYHIACYFDRLDRDNFKLINKNCSQLIPSQKLLNNDYQQACTRKNIDKIALLRKQGALHCYEEIYKLSVDTREDRKNIAKKLWDYYSKKSTMIIEGFTYAIEHNNVPFVLWILNLSTPKLKSPELTSAIRLSKKLNYSLITDHLNHYIEQEKLNEQEKEAAYGLYTLCY
jgi:hypothetical protein